MKPLAERQLVNSWNIKDPLQYKLDLQSSLEPDLWQWIQSDQIIYSDTNDLSIFIDQEVVKTFSQDQDRISSNKTYGNLNKSGNLRKPGQFSQGNTLYLSAYQKQTKKCKKLQLNYKCSDF
jgi:hypothetical protein